MKRFCTVLFVCLLAVLPRAWSEGADEQYIGIYAVIKQGDLYLERGQSLQAVAKYSEAQGALQKFQVKYPQWNVNVVKYRLNYLNGRIADLSGKPVPATPPPATNAVPTTVANPPKTEVVIPPTAPVVTNPPAKIVEAPPVETKPPQTQPETPPIATTPKPADPQALPPDVVDRIVALQNQVARLEADKGVLESKLKEALAAQPAATDPRELAKAQERIRGLEKENDLLKFSLAQAKTNSVQANMALLDQTRKELAEANRKVTELTDANTVLTTERNALQAKIKTMTAPPDSLALRQENEILKKELAELKTKAASASPSDEIARKLMESQTQLAAMQSDKEILRIEKMALEDRIRELTMKTNAPAVAVVPVASLDSASSGKIKQLEFQRDELQKSLDAATKEIYGKKKGKETATRIDEMTKQLTALRARIDTLEAKQTPYSSEELALMSQPGRGIAPATVVGKSPPKEVSPKMAALTAEGQRLWLEHRMPEAEAKYLEALKLDEKNALALMNLATIQFDLKKDDVAEKNMQAALALEPTNQTILFNFGYMRMNQGKFDDALDYFSRSAEIDPNDATLQIYLGITLSEKGLRGPAESAFRKAIQLDPANGQAHANLAVVYITQTPPLVELARWHYQKAVGVGYKPNPRLEKMLFPDGVTAGK